MNGFLKKLSAFFLVLCILFLAGESAFGKKGSQGKGGRPRQAGKTEQRPDKRNYVNDDKEGDRTRRKDQIRQKKRQGERQGERRQGERRQKERQGNINGETGNGKSNDEKGKSAKKLKGEKTGGEKAKGRNKQQQLESIEKQITHENEKHQKRLERLKRIGKVAGDDEKTKKRSEELAAKEQKRYEKKIKKLTNRKQKIDSEKPE